MGIRLTKLRFCILGLLGSVKNPVLEASEGKHLGSFPPSLVVGKKCLRNEVFVKAGEGFIYADKTRLDLRFFAPVNCRGGGYSH